MSYVVLARKYRPMRFADMIGQEHIGRTLGNAIKQDRVHHAYLFAGARGLGKTTTARIFAKGLVCEKGPTPEPCNECSECVAVSEGRSVDVMEIDGASNNSVDNIRNLREQVHYLPQTARRKVYIIDEVHMLTTSAFNALLKTLEEPPPHVNFVFATTEPQKVLPTILSRVNRLDFKRVSPGQLVGYLRSILDQEGLSVDDGGLRIVARAGEGSVRDALTLLDQVIAFAEDPKAVGEDEVRRLLGQADAGAVHELVGSILDRDPSATMQRFDALVSGGHDLSVLSLQVLEHLRDLAVIRVCDAPAVLPDATDAEIAALRAQAGKAPASHLGQLFDRFSRVIDRLPQSRSQRLLVEMGLLDLACAEPVIPLGDLVDQLHALGRGAPPSGAAGRGPGRASGGARGRTTGGSGRAQASAPMPGGFVPPEMPSFPSDAREREAPGRPLRDEPFEREPPIDSWSPPSDDPRLAPGSGPMIADGPEAMGAARASQAEPRGHAGGPHASRTSPQEPTGGSRAPQADAPGLTGAPRAPQADAPGLTGAPQADAPGLTGAPRAPQADAQGLTGAPRAPQADAPGLTGAPRAPQADAPGLTGAPRAPQADAPGLTGAPRAPQADAPEPTEAPRAPQSDAPGLTGAPRTPQADAQGLTGALRAPQSDAPEPTGALRASQADAPGLTGAPRAPQTDAQEPPGPAEPPRPEPGPAISSSSPERSSTPPRGTTEIPSNSFTAKLLDMAMQSGVVIPDEEAPPSAPEPTPTHAAPAHGTNGKARPGTNGAPVSGLEPAGPIMGAGPCLPPPAADGVVPWEELSAFEAWEQLVGRIRGEDEFLSAVLGEVGLVELAGGTLRVASPRGSFAHTELTRHPQVRAQIEQACRDHLGAPFTVELVEGDPMLPELPSVVLVAQQRRAEHRAQVEAEARAHPAIQTLLRTFDASLVSTKPLHEP